MRYTHTLHNPTLTQPPPTVATVTLEKNESETSNCGRNTYRLFSDIKQLSITLQLGTSFGFRIYLTLQFCNWTA